LFFLKLVFGVSIKVLKKESNRHEKGSSAPVKYKARAFSFFFLKQETDCNSNKKQ